VDPADIPESAKLPSAARLDTIAAPVLSQKKRKATHEAVAGSSSQATASRMSQPGTSQPLRRFSQTAALQEMEAEDYEANLYEEEQKDELYCVLNSKIVGVNYYKGPGFSAFLLLSY
jgi:SWI/SNF-related matrix-associated actin-dependent regulator of chromatin subfamily A3